MNRKKGPKAKKSARERRRNRIFWDRYVVEVYPSLLSVALVLQNNDVSKAQDLVQTVIARILNYAPDKNKENPLNYLKRALKNAWHDAHRKTVPEVSLEALAESDPDNPALRVPADIEEKLIAKFGGLISAGGSGKLSQTMKLRNAGHTFQETADILGEPVSRTKYRVYTHYHKVGDRSKK